MKHAPAQHASAKQPPSADLPDRHPAFTRVVALICVACMLIYGAVYVYLDINQRSYIFYPSQSRIAPQKAGFPEATEIAIQTQDGEKLVAWYAPPAPGKPLLIYFHGNGGSLDNRAARLKTLSEGGNGVLAVDWRGYGGSTGTPSQQGFLDDAMATYLYALSTGVTPKHIVLIGESLGTGVALWLAGEKPVAGLVLDSPYSSIADVVSGRLWMFPTNAIIKDPFPAAEWIKRVNVPIFAIHGEQDQVIPIGYAKKLLENAPGQKTFIPIGDSGHLVLGKGSVMQQARAWIAAITH